MALKYIAISAIILCINFIAIVTPFLRSRRQSLDEDEGFPFMQDHAAPSHYHASSVDDSAVIAAFDSSFPCNNKDPMPEHVKSIFGLEKDPRNGIVCWARQEISDVKIEVRLQQMYNGFRIIGEDPLVAYYNPKTGAWWHTTGSTAVAIERDARRLLQGSIPPLRPSIEACKGALHITDDEDIEINISRVIRLVSRNEHQYNDGTPMSAIFADIVSFHRKGMLHLSARQCSFDATRGKMLQYRIQPRSSEQ